MIRRRSRALIARMSMPSLPPLHRPLSLKIGVVLMVSMFVALICIGYTLLLSWQLEGGAAAINDAGSLRMRSWHIATLTEQAVRTANPEDREMLDQEIALFDQTLAGLIAGDPARPLVLPPNLGVQTRLAQVTRQWTEQIKPAVEQVARGGTMPRATFYQDMAHQVETIHGLVSAIEHIDSQKTSLLRSFQLILIALAVIGTIAMIYSLHLIIIRPVNALKSGIVRMGNGDLTARLPVESQDEFGELAQGFNHMATQLQGLYGTLEQRVQDKTHRLAARNRELGALYDMSTFLNQATTVEGLCAGFMERIRQLTGADGAVVRVVDPENERLHVVVQQGMPTKLMADETCKRMDSCYCGEVARQGVSVIQNFRTGKPERHIAHCERAGFVAMGAFPVCANQQQLGMFDLHFHQPRDISASERQLLETLGQHLGIAIENQRLAARQRAVAIAEERNLVAQGLHDSIAQGLSFLNLQVQLLQDAVEEQDQSMIREILPLLRTGVQESYDDVRELLLNFRTRIGQGDLTAGIRATIQRFEKQTGLEVAFQQTGLGPPLTMEQQVQVLYIVQEALSNIRKHARASSVTVEVRNQADLEVSIHDNGRGIDLQQLYARSDTHVGLKIMQERAQRVHGRLMIHSIPGEGTCITMTVPQTERKAA